ncbi:MAG: hypothetical protein Q7R30_02395 [Acidobacteriota bacterium]|nr:hypothetical protein [Acidobacteriota bacterium]
MTVKLLPAIVAVPDRDDAEVFCAHETVTAFDPLPLVGDTVIQEPFPDAVQLPPVQPAGDPVTVTLCDPAPEVGLAEVGPIEKLVQIVVGALIVICLVAVLLPSLLSLTAPRSSAKAPK